jgi:hypothetical protein
LIIESETSAFAARVDELRVPLVSLFCREQPAVIAKTTVMEQTIVRSIKDIRNREENPMDRPLSRHCERQACAMLSILEGLKKDVKELQH